MKRLFKTIVEVDTCLCCGVPVDEWGSWTWFRSGASRTPVCSSCQKQLIRIPSRIGCPRCRKAPLQKPTLSGVSCWMPATPPERSLPLCHDCRGWLQGVRGDDLLWNHSFFQYNAFCQSLVARFKYRGDVAVAGVVNVLLRDVVRGWKPDVLVPIPVSKERGQERGFNQAKALIEEAGLLATDALWRLHRAKQAKGQLAERFELEGVFQLQNDVDVTGKRVLLVDDVYTTGATVHEAAHVLKQSGQAKEVASVTMARAVE